MPEVKESFEEFLNKFVKNLSISGCILLYLDGNLIA